MANGLRYYGKKNEEYLCRVAQMLPLIGLSTYCDCCFGSGNFTRLIPCEMRNINRVAFELDRGLYALHKVIKSNDVIDLTDMIKTVINSKEDYKKYEEIVKKYNSKIKEYPEIEVALAELVLIYFSMNNGRTNWRNKDSYKKYENEIKRSQSRLQLQAMTDKFYNRLPGDLYDLHCAWQEVDIINDDFRNHYDELYCNDKAFLFIDPPYLLDKRGRKRDGTAKNAGYDMDWVLNDHEEFVEEIIRYHHENKLHAKLMICSNFEVDDNGLIIGVDDDPYIRLMKDAGFRLVIVQEKFSSEIKTSEGGHKKKKVEVVFINYQHDNIVGSWDNFRYFDAEDLNSTLRI